MGCDSNAFAGNPKHRPQTMQHVLAHPFFAAEDVKLPLVPLLHGAPDVIISYQSTQVAQMKRLRRALNVLGITTADGTQVPAGEDWRAWCSSLSAVCD